MDWPGSVSTVSHTSEWSPDFSYARGCEPQPTTTRVSVTTTGPPAQRPVPIRHETSPEARE